MLRGCQQGGKDGRIFPGQDGPILTTYRAEGLQAKPVSCHLVNREEKAARSGRGTRQLIWEGFVSGL